MAAGEGPAAGLLSRFHPAIPALRDRPADHPLWEEGCSGGLARYRLRFNHAAAFIAPFAYPPRPMRDGGEGLAGPGALHTLRSLLAIRQQSRENQDRVGSWGGVGPHPRFQTCAERALRAPSTLSYVRYNSSGTPVFPNSPY